MMAINHINNLYQSHGFQIMQANMDVEFELIRSGVLGLGINLNTVLRDEHAPESERNGRTVKDRVGSALNTPPFRKVSDRIIIEIVLGQVFWMNIFSDKYGVSKTNIPRHIMSGLKIDYHCHCRIACGQCVQTHEQHGKNMMDSTVGAIDVVQPKMPPSISFPGI